MELTRRKWLKAGALFVPALMANAQVLFKPSPAFNVIAAGGGGGSCPADGSPSASNDGATASQTWGAGRRYFGQSRWTDGGTPRTICKLGFKITGVSGASSSTFKAYIFANSASPNYNFDTTVLAESAGITGVDAWSQTWVYFDLSAAPFTTTANAAYVLCVGPTVARVTNDMTCYQDNTALTGYRDYFSAAGAADQAGGNDAAIKIFWQ